MMFVLVLAVMLLLLLVVMVVVVLMGMRSVAVLMTLVSSGGVMPLSNSTRSKLLKGFILLNSALEVCLSMHSRKSGNQC